MKHMNYKNCPLKKRPIKYVDEETPKNSFPIFAEVQSEALPLLKKRLKTDEPEDLTVKRNVQEACLIDDHQFTAKRCCFGCYCPYRNTSISSSVGACTEDFNGCCTLPHTSNNLLRNTVELREYLGKYRDYSNPGLQETNIYLTKSAYTDYAHESFRSAFVAAIGYSDLPAFCPPQSNIVSADILTPASSVTSDSQEFSYPTNSRSNGTWPHFTPPSSPICEDNTLPEDLTMHNDIPLPALYHFTDSDKNKRAEILRHTNNEHLSTSNRKAEKCKYCNKVYYTHAGLLKHQQFHCQNSDLNVEKKVYTCATCGKVYKAIGALKMHEHTHTLPCKCPICGKAFSRPWLLQGHIRTHTGEKPFRCTLCSRSFADRSNLRAHQQTHVDVKKYSCDKCSKSFSRISLLNKHHENKSCT